MPTFFYIFVQGFFSIHDVKTETTHVWDGNLFETEIENH